MLGLMYLTNGLGVGQASGPEFVKTIEAAIAALGGKEEEAQQMIDSTTPARAVDIAREAVRARGT